MKSLCIVTIFVVFLSPLILASGEPPARSKGYSIRINHRGSFSEKDATKGELCVLDGELMFVAFLVNRLSPGGPGDPQLPDYSLHFVWEGPLWDHGTLRAKISPRNLLVDREGKFSKELLAKDGWYVTADFSSDPPQVILKEQPGKGSHWTFNDADLPGRHLIKNTDAPGKAVWLTVEKEGKTYHGGIARKPILSAEKHRFSIEEANSGK